jgi:metal-responsive CopG/Arc/MetJ family transcriptional regulator
MQRTNIYLADEQRVALDELARAEGTSRAELIRRLLDRALAGDAENLIDDLAAIDDSFGVLAGDDLQFERRADERMRHLQRIAAQ